MSKTSVSPFAKLADLSALFIRLSEATEAIFTPPFKGALIVAWVALVFSNVQSPLSIFDGHLHDPDNYLYLVQANDLLNGQSWFDHIQRRMNPPEGTYIHYSNFLAVLYAGMIYVLTPLLGAVPAAFATTAIFPPLFFLAFLLILRRLAQTFVDKEWGDAVAYLAIFSPSILTRFLIGHVDHHGIVAIFIVIAYGGMLYLCLKPSAGRVATLAGCALSLSLAFALESVSFVGLFSLCLGGWAVAKGGEAARSGLVFSLALCVGAALLLLGVRAPAHWFEADLLAYSVVYVILTSSIALCFAGVALVRNRSLRVRASVGALLAVLTGGVFLAFFPDLANGPYGGMNPEVRKIIFSTAPEAWPIIRGNELRLQQVGNILWAALSLAANWILVARASSREYRWIWGINLVLLLAATALSGFYQIRFNIYSHIFAILPLTALTKMMWEESTTPKARSTFWLAVISLPVVLVLCGSTFFDDDTARAVKDFKPTKPGCDMQALASALSDPQGYGREPKLIINSLNESSELLLRTPHSVLSGPYHTNVSGNLDAQRFFTARDSDVSKAIALQRGAGFVLVCRVPGQLLPYRGKAYAAGGEKMFLDRLLDKEIPDWLKPVGTNFGDILLFEVNLPKAPL